MANQSEFEHLLPALGPQTLMLPYPDAAFGLGIDGANRQWEVRTAGGRHHSFLPPEMPLAVALHKVQVLCSAGDDEELVDSMWGTRAPSSDEPARDVPELDIGVAGRVCWAHPVYDGEEEIWRPRAPVETTYPTIAAFLAAKEAEGWEIETFPEQAAAADGLPYPVLAVSLTRTRFGGAPQDDLIHVWVAPAMQQSAARSP